MSLLSIFSGGGLADLGASAAGWKPAGAVEYDPAIAECYAANLGDHVIVGDVRTVDYRPWAGVEALWASPVCTRASIANQGEGEGPEDMEMACAVVRAVRETGPRVVALENVWGYRKFRAFEHIQSSLLEMGYAVTVEHLCAADFGVAQTRRRLILRARRDGRGFPQVRRTHCEGGHSGLLPEYDLLPSLKEQVKIDRENGLAIVGVLYELDDPDLQYGLRAVITRLADAALFAIDSIDSISAEYSKEKGE